MAKAHVTFLKQSADNLKAAKTRHTDLKSLFKEGDSIMKEQAELMGRPDAGEKETQEFLKLGKRRSEIRELLKAEPYYVGSEFIGF